jgi:hypothetical protein
MYYFIISYPSSKRAHAERSTAATNKAGADFRAMAVDAEAY